MKKSTKRLLVLTSAAVAGMYAYNRLVDSNAARKNLLKVDNGHYYKWKEGNIFYTQNGTGTPLLLVHDTDSRASGEEWSKIIKKLSKKKGAAKENSVIKKVLSKKIKKCLLF